MALSPQRSSYFEVGKHRRGQTSYKFVWSHVDVAIQFFSLVYVGIGYVLGFGFGEFWCSLVIS